MKHRLPLLASGLALAGLILGGGRSKAKLPRLVPRGGSLEASVTALPPRAAAPRPARRLRVSTDGRRILPPERSRPLPVQGLPPGSRICAIDWAASQWSRGKGPRHKDFLAVRLMRGRACPRPGKFRGLTPGVVRIARGRARFLGEPACPRGLGRAELLRPVLPEAGRRASEDPALLGTCRQPGEDLGGASGRRSALVLWDSRDLKVLSLVVFRWMDVPRVLAAGDQLFVTCSGCPALLGRPRQVGYALNILWVRPRFRR